MDRSVEKLIAENIPRDHMSESEERAFVFHWFDEYERTGFAGTFDSPYSDQKKYQGQSFEVLGRCGEATHDLEALPVWKIRLACGDEIEAFPEEICNLERGLQPDNRFDELKAALFNWGMDYIEDFLGYEVDRDEDKDVIENRLDAAYEQMPDDVLADFYAKFKIGQEVKPSLSEQIQNADAKAAAQLAPVFLFEEDKSGDRMGKPGDFNNVYYANWFEFYSIGAAGVVRKETGSLEFSAQGKRLPGGGEARCDAIQKFADAQIGRDVVVLSIERSGKDLHERIFNALEKYNKDHKSIMVLPAYPKSSNLNDPTR